MRSVCVYLTAGTLLVVASCASDPPATPPAPPVPAPRKTEASRPAPTPQPSVPPPADPSPLIDVATSRAEVARAPDLAASTRPTSWARPLALEGVPNLNQVSERLYRGGQPEAQGFRALADLGVKTIINLRAFHSDRDELTALPLQYYHISIPGWDVADEHVVAFLKLLRAAPEGPIYVHCWHGADRTGVMCAAYRMVIQGWSPAEAGREMREGGYGFHPLWQNMIDYVEHFDTAAIAEQAGYPKPATPPGPQRER